MAAPDDKDAAKPARSEERTTERRLVSAQNTATPSLVPESMRDVTGEDFLFHLYRGSELLQDNRILEAKEELEQALTHQPRDSKGQDLLAVVYFRLGLYPRAIQIYEELKREAPSEAAIRLNLALCYLKTGQAQLARAELEDVVAHQPGHKRAWGYLGLAYERVGDLEKALHAFERGGHPAMAQRLTDKAGAKSLRALAERADVRNVASAAFEELDAGEVTFSIAEPVTASKAASGTWRTVELGQPNRPSGPPPADRWSVPPPVDAATRSDRPGPPSLPRDNGRGVHAPAGLAELIDRARLAPPREPGLLVHSDGFAIARIGEAPEHPFAARTDAIRSQSAKLTVEVLSRHQRGKPTGEPFGGLASPLVRIAGTGEIVVAPRPGHNLVAFALKEDTIYAREEALLGFELSLTFENGKLPLSDGEATAIAQLRGTGCVLFELVDAMGAVEVSESRPLLARHDATIAWTSRVTPRAVPTSEAPGGQRGLLSFSGHGFVLLTR